MTADERKKLEDAMVASQLENLMNVDAIDSLSDEVEKMMRLGHRGFAQMDDEELLNTAKNDVGFASDEGEAQPWEDNDGIDEYVKLINIIREIDRTIR